MRTSHRLSAALAPAVVVGAAHAGTVQYMASVPLMRTNYVSSLSIPRFDPALGTLQSVEFMLGGRVEGDVRFESLDAAPSTITWELSAQIELRRPDNSLIGQVNPVIDGSENLSAYDGVTDFAGSSGRTFNNLASMADFSFISPPPASDLALFTGMGNITLPVIATATSTASGSGNLVAQFRTEAAAMLLVIYNFSNGAVIPAPAAAGMGAAGLAGLALARRRPR